MPNAKESKKRKTSKDDETELIFHFFFTSIMLLRKITPLHTNSNEGSEKRFKHLKERKI